MTADDPAVTDRRYSKKYIDCITASGYKTCWYIGVLRDNDVPEPNGFRGVFFCSGKGGFMTRLFLTNIPYDCEETDLQQWIEARGFDVESVRLIRDLVAGVSPACGYVSLRGKTD